MIHSKYRPKVIVKKSLKLQYCGCIPPFFVKLNDSAQNMKEVPFSHAYEATQNQGFLNNNP